ncbi:MAG: hypothetical protein HRT88_11925 [Lentisphaeraceae bacterium]|nr:hypothetical protein [Lentisphaeraceae bacterium]
MSVGNAFEGRVHEVRLDDPLLHAAENLSVTLKRGSLRRESQLKSMVDFNAQTMAALTSDAKGVIELHFSCSKASIKTYYLMSKKKKDHISTKLEYFHKGSWHAFGWCKIEGLQAFIPTVNSVKSNKFRFTLTSEKRFDIDITELRLLTL